MDAPIADASAPDAGRAGGELCFWQTGGGYDLKHFRFLLTTPDGRERNGGWDAGSRGIEVFEGRIASVEGNRFSVDGCLTTATCQPSLYQFTLCSTGHGACAATDLPPSLSTVLPLNRRVRVEWGMGSGIGHSLYWLAVYDAEPVANPGSVLFVGSGGYQPDYYGAPLTPLARLPFTVALRSLKCEELRPYASQWGNDYAFLFTSANAEDPPLSLASGESGTLTFTWGSGAKQSLDVRCLVAVQPMQVTGDYYNWDFWATNATPLAPPSDAGIVNGADAGQDLAGRDLPPGWEQAVKVDVTQEAIGLAGASAKPVVSLWPGAGHIYVQVRGATGRCDQQTVGWVRSSADQLELLLQPSDMHPAAVGKCATAYNLKTTVPAPSGTLTVVVSQRSDAYAGEPSLTELARVSVAVP